jgi:putative transposase
MKGVELFVSGKCLGLVENLAKFYPEAKWQRCIVHFYRNVWTAVPSGKVKEVAAMLKAIHAQEDASAAKENARQVAIKLREMRLARAAEIVENGLEEILSLLRVTAGTLALPENQQPTGAAAAGDPAAHPSRWCVP